MKYFNKIAFLIFILFLQTKIWSQAEITDNELEVHVKFLASDSLKGRKPGTKESVIASKYIASTFKNYGLKLIGENGFQYFNIKPEVEAGENKLKCGKSEFLFGQDFNVLSYSENVKVKSGLVFIGYGLEINSDSIKWNDYSGVDVKGKFVLIMRGRPEMNNPDSKFFDYGSDYEKIETAKAKGASGVVLVSPFGTENEDKLLPLRPERNNQKCGIPVIHVKREVANILLVKSGKNIDMLEKEINLSLKPYSFDTKVKIDIKTEVNYVPVQTCNVVAFLEGSDSVLKSEYIIIGAHWDHLGYGGPGSGSRRADSIAIHNGADDNASGVATMLEIAQYLASKKDSLKRSVLFIAFGAEELGLIGSQYYVNNPLLDLKSVIAMLNFDMVGRLNKETKSLTLSGTGTAKEWEDIFNIYQKKTSIKFSYSKEGFGSSDHSSFYSRNIPVIHFFTGTHDDYHTPKDDAQLIDYQGQEEISKICSQIAFQLLTQSDRLKFQEVGSKDRKSSMGSLKVTLGVMPGFGNDDIVGLKVEGVTKDKPAYKAGIKVGDIITAINDEKISNIYDYMDKLKKYKPGDKITVDVKRGEDVMVFTVDF